MVTEVIYCRHCRSDGLVKNGLALNNGKQKSTFLMPAGVRAARSLLPTATPKSARGGDPGAPTPGAASEPLRGLLGRTFGVSPTTAN